jgi:hypothetical protein
VVSTPVDLDAARCWIASCACCDAGTGTCTCPEGDFRSVMGDLIDEIERLRGQVQELRMDLSNAAYDADRSSKWERR